MIQSKSVLATEEKTIDGKSWLKVYVGWYLFELSYDNDLHKRVTTNLSADELVDFC